MKKIIVLSLMLVVLTGCLETEQEIYLNPDGSGKFVMRYAVLPSMAGTIGAQYDAKSHDEVAHEIAKDMVKSYAQFNFNEAEGSKEYLYCSELDYGVTDTGSYFVNTVVYCSSMNDITELGEFLNFSYKKNEQGQLVFSLSNANDINDIQELYSDSKEQAGDEPMDQEVLKVKVRELKMQLEQTKGSLEGYLAGFKNKAEYHIAGKVVEQNGFKEEQGVLVLNSNGEDVLKNFQALIDDEEQLATLVKEDCVDIMYLQSNLALMSKVMFGTDSIRLVVEADESKEKFDFTKEIEEAKQKHSELLKELEIEVWDEVATIEIEADNIPSILSVEVAGVTTMSKPYREQGGGRGYSTISSFDSKEPGINLLIYAGFNVEIAGIENVVVEKVMDDKGRELRLKKDANQWRRQQLSNDRKNVVFKTNTIDIPSEDAKYFKSIRGTIVCKAMNKPKIVESGKIEIKDNARSEDGNIEVNYVNNHNSRFSSYSEGDVSGEVDLIIKHDEGHLVGVILLDEEGKEIPTTANLNLSYNGNYKVDVEFRKLMPDSVMVKLEVVDGVELIELPFEIKRVDFSGRALKEKVEELVLD